MQRLLGAIAVVLLANACGQETPHSSVSFMSFEHEHPKRHYLNLLIEHVHDDTWHIPYSTEVPKNFNAALTKALQTWLQPLQTLELARPIVNDFKYYQYDDSDPGVSNVPWNDVLFKTIFKAGNSGNNAKGDYIGIFIQRNSGLPPPTSLSIDELPRVTVYDVGEVDVELTRHTEFMFTLVHEIGHAFGLSDTYTASGDRISGRKGNQPASIMASSREVHNHPPVLPAGVDIELTTDDIKGLLWLYKRYYTDEIKELADCYFDDYQHESSPSGCVPNTIEPPPPPPDPPEPVEPPPPEPPTPPEPVEPPEPPPPGSCAADPCSDNCLTGCRYRNCGYDYANPQDRYRTSCRSLHEGQWCGSAGQGREDVCHTEIIPPPPPPEPEPEVTVNDIAAQCCNAGYSCARWPGNADIYLCRAEDDAQFDARSPCCHRDIYECESWPGRAAAALCFGH